MSKLYKRKNKTQVTKMGTSKTRGRLHTKIAPRHPHQPTHVVYGLQINFTFKYRAKD